MILLVREFGSRAKRDSRAVDAGFDRYGWSTCGRLASGVYRFIHELCVKNTVTPV